MTDKRNIMSAPADTPEPKWRSDAPPARAIVIAGHTPGLNKVMEYIGKVTEYMASIENMNVWFYGVRLDPGVWVVEFDVRSHVSETADGREYDEDLEILSTRPANAEELQAVMDGDCPWDRNHWAEWSSAGEAAAMPEPVSPAVRTRGCS